MFRLRNNGIRCLFSVYYSKVAAAAAAATKTRNTLLVEMLVNSVGLSRDKAISASAKVTRLKPGNNKPDLVLDFFKQIGLNKTQIKTLVSSSPMLLFVDVDKTLKPKIKVLQELGLSGSDLARVLSKTGTLLRSSRDNFIKPNLDYLRKLLGNDDFLLAKAVSRDPIIICYNIPKIMPPNIEALQNLGFSGKDIEKLVLQHSRLLLVKKSEWLENAVHQVEKVLNIPRHSPMFIYGIIAIASLRESRLEMKLETFRRFGWSDSDILMLMQKQPLCLSLSEAKLENALNFLMKELGYGAHYLACRPMLLTASLEKRVMPRHEILEVLSRKKLTKCALYSAVVLPEVKFLKNYVLPFMDEMPELYELYKKSRR